MLRSHALRPFALAALVASAAFCSAASAQIAFTEPPDLTGQDLGTAAVGANTITGSLNVSVSGGSPAMVTGDIGDQFSFTIPAGVYVTAVDMTISSFSSSGSATANPGVRFVSLPPSNYAYCATTSGLNTLTIPATDGRLGPGAYSFEVFTGKSGADTAGTRSFNYVVRFHAVAETGACCNPSTLACTVQTGGACPGGLVVGSGTTCTPTSCTPQWSPGAWGTCTVLCGGGTQTRAVPCTIGTTPVADVVCLNGGAGTKPPYTQACNTAPCTGACCNRHTGGCLVLSAADCATFGGAYAGSSTVCSPATCTACPADFNGVGGVTIDDLFLYINAYFVGC